MESRKGLLKLVFVLAAMVSMNAKLGAQELDVIVGLGYDFGGEKLGTVIFEDGKKEDIKSHEGLLIYAGVDYGIMEDLIVRGTLGYKFDSVTASNGEAEFKRIPIEVLFAKLIGPHRLGGGLAYHTSVEYSCKIDNVCDFTNSYKDALGYVVQYEYQVSPPEEKLGMLLGVRYTSVDYKPTSFGSSFGGSGIGINFSVLF